MKLTLLFSLITLTVLAQTKISGTITDGKGEAIPGANVVIQNSYDGASSAIDGTFAFTSEEKGAQILSVSYVGYKAFQQKIVLNGSPLEFKIELREEINQLEGVVISAGSFTAGDEKRRTILKAVDIVTTAGATADISGALNTLPGTTKVGETGRLFVRGGDDSETRTFIDGMAVLNAYNVSAPSTPSRNRFPPFMFKGTSFSTGGYSAEYGQALSAALVLNSKDKAEMNQTDIGILSVGGDIAHTQVWEKSSLTGKLTYTNIRPYYGVINQRVDWKVPYASVEGSGAYRQTIGRKGGSLKTYGNFNHADFSMYQHDVAHPENKNLYELNNNYRYGNAAYQQPLNEKWSLRSGLSYSYNENALKIEGTPREEKEQGVHSKVVFENSVSDRIEVRLGGEVIARRYAASRKDSITLQNLSTRFNETISAAFGETEIYAGNKFVTRSGARLEYNGLNNKTSVDPRISVSYKPGKQGQFSFAYGRFRQSAKNQYLRVNTDLSSERAEHFILNYQVTTDYRTLRVEAYYKKYLDLVKFINGNPYLLNNAGTGYAKGAELFWRDNKSLKNVDYWISYSFLDTKRDYLNFPYAAMPNFASRHNFSVVYKHFITPLKTQLGVTYSYGSPRPYYNPNNDRFNGDCTPSYQDLSANVSYLPKNWLIIYASCTNLLGRHNVFGYQYSSTPDANGVYAGRPVVQPAKHMLLLAVLITISKNKSVNQLRNL
jgi:hypothetical protein